MSYFKLTQEQAEEMLWEDESGNLRVIDRTPWTANKIKGYSCTVVFIDTANDNYYKYKAFRTGSEYSDWTYEYNKQARQVFRIEKTIIIYE